MLLTIGILAASFSTQLPPLRLEATRDLWVSHVGDEADGNNGGAGKLKLKSIQEFSLIDFDLNAIKGHTVRKATLHLRCTGAPHLQRVTVGSVAAEWFEGTAANYERQVGSSTFRSQKHPDIPWTDDGGDLCRVILGNGGTIWGMADTSVVDKDGWQAILVDPAVIAARVAGVSHGFVLFDDTGSEWKRDGERFERQLFPNRFVFSRESGRTRAPFLSVEMGEVDKDPPQAPTELTFDPADLPAGEVWASWKTPADRGAAGVVGFRVQVGNDDVPRYQIPRPGKIDERVHMKLRKQSGSDLTLNVQAIDGAGNVGPAIRKSFRFSDRVAKPLPRPAAVSAVKPAALPLLGRAEVAIIDELDKLPPQGGSMIPPQPDGYLAANHLWDAESKVIRLHAARKEFVAFQIVLQGRVTGFTPRLEFESVAKSKPAAEFGIYRNVATKNGPLPDPIVRLHGPVDLPESGNKSASIHVEIYVPDEFTAGIHRGKLILNASGLLPLVLPIELKVWDFALPDSLHFLPEMNCYGLPDNERDYYRLAQRHRVVLNRLPYSQDGRVHDGCSPKWDGKTLDWAAWDQRFGPYLDGSAFADSPRGRTPVECFYLPIHENWPTPMKGNYNEDLWADRAFPQAYRRDFVEVSRQFAAHFHEKKWSRTLFEGFLNNKVDFKLKGWSRGSSPWLLDEPANFQDFWALRYFGSAFHEGFNAAGTGPAHMVFRCDLSRPQWQRDSLDGLLDVNVVGGAMRTYRPLVMDRKAANGEVVIEYGGSNAVEDSNAQPVAWSLDVWTLGGDGVLPWQTVGNEDSWTKADELSLFYPKRDADGPVPSVRLKAYRRGQQDVEYLTLWMNATSEPRWAVASRVREALALDARRKNAGGEDAGTMHYGRLAPRDFWELRVRIGEAVSALKPVPSTSGLGFATPKRDLASLPPKLVR